MTDYQIPNKINATLVFVSCMLSITLLYLTSHISSWPLKIIPALLFSFVNNTVFSLLHEAVHGILNSNPRINYVFGVFLAAFFPTGFTFQSACHMSHHIHNRDSAEQFDLIRPGDNPLLRRLQWYGILTGLYWTLLPISALLILLIPNQLFNLAKCALLKDQASSTGALAMLQHIQNCNLKRARIEILISFIIQGSILYLIHFDWASWILCYALFGISWSSLQYTDHAWSKLDRTEGAWDLRIHWLIQSIFLNYHLHRAHHQHPNVSWIYLPTLINEEKPRPYFHKLYLLMWKGPQPISHLDAMYKKVLSTCL